MHPRLLRSYIPGPCFLSRHDQSVSHDPIYATFQCRSFNRSLWIIIVSLLLIGLGQSAKLVSSFVGTLNHTIKVRGYPDDRSTYGMVSALFFSSCSLGSVFQTALAAFLTTTEKQSMHRTIFRWLLFRSVRVQTSHHLFNFGRGHSCKFDLVRVRVNCNDLLGSDPDAHRIQIPRKVFPAQRIQKNLTARCPSTASFFIWPWTNRCILLVTHLWTWTFSL